MTHILPPFTGNAQRIDVFLTTQFPYSRNFFHHIITRGGILVNDRKIKKSYSLSPGDVVYIDDIQRFLEPELLIEAPNIELPVVYEDEHMLVVNKPKGVLSHPNSIRDVQAPSVVGFLYHRYKKLPSIGSFIRAGLVHRLDKETDGLMVVAKTEQGLAHLKSLFQKKSRFDSIESKESVPLRKCYRATCHITDLGRSFLNTLESDGMPYYLKENVIAKVPHHIIKEGITKIMSFTEHQTDKGLLGTVTINVEILTGRTHQIRYHLSHHGLPIVGDYLYGTDEGVPMALTAYRLELMTVDGEYKVFEV